MFANIINNVVPLYCKTTLSKKWKKLKKKSRKKLVGQG